MLPSETPRSVPGKVEGLSNTNYARTAKELNQFIRNIRAEGAQSDLNLPRVAVIGNQSAGKSSLVEAISEVSIRWESDLRGVRSVREVPFGNAFGDVNNVETMLRRAQAAVLNPAVDHTAILEMDNHALKSLFEQAPQKFSKNVVCVDISGPGLPDLSFVDLPGLIQNDEGNGEVQMVEELVKSYIKSDNTIILVALPMTDDIQNQKAAQLAREFDPDGLRTIGALTKPDALPDGSIGAKNTYLNVVAGRLHRTKHGYYAVRLPDDAEREQNITHQEARAAEARFFAEKAPWATSQYHHRFGVEKLISCVGERLTERIRADLPRIQQEVATQRRECMEQLQELPPKTTEPHSHVLRLTSVFAEEVKQFVEGSPDHRKLVQDNKRSYEKFTKAILDTAPPFLPFESGWYVPQTLPAKLQAAAVSRGYAICLNDVKSRIQASVTRELPNNVPYAVKRGVIRSFQQDWPTHADRCLEEVEGTLKIVLANRIKKHFSRFRHLEGVVRAAVMDLVDAHAAVADQQQGYMLKYESNPPSTQDANGLARLRSEWLATYRDARAQSTYVPETQRPTASSAGSNLPTNPSRESQVPHSGPMFVFGAKPGKVANGTSSRPGESPPAFDSIQAPTASAVSFAAPPATSVVHADDKPEKQSTAAQSPSKSTGNQSPAPVSSWSSGPLNGSHTPALQNLSAADPYEEELAFMAEIRAYFDISSRRLVDNIPAALDEHMLYAFSEALFDTLVEKLGLASEDASVRCAKYLAEDPDVSALREDLQAKKKRLDRVYKELCEFGL